MPPIPAPDGPQALRLEGSDWWRGAVGYEIYVRSVTNGDGIGGLAGIADRLPYPVVLGIDVVSITPFTPSPGFDVRDNCVVEPSTERSLIGTDPPRPVAMPAFVDLVPNQTSSQHEWFRRAVADPTPDGGWPNNWLSHLGRLAWTIDPRSSDRH